MGAPVVKSVIFIQVDNPPDLLQSLQQASRTWVQGDAAGLVMCRHHPSPSSRKKKFPLLPSISLRTVFENSPVYSIPYFIYLCSDLYDYFWEVVAEPWKTPGFFTTGGEEFNPGPKMRLDRSELLCNKVLLKYKRGRESFWHRLQKGAERVPAC